MFGQKLGHWLKSLKKNLCALLWAQFGAKFMKLCQNVNFDKTKSSSILGHVGSKTRSLAQIMKKHCVHSRGHSCDQKFMKLCQNVNSHKL